MVSAWILVLHVPIGCGMLQGHLGARGRGPKMSTKAYRGLALPR